MSNLIAIVGRPNVGKSTFFNRLIGQRQAIIHESSGVTRDRHYGRTTWNGIDFSVVDTGGYVSYSDDVFENAIRRQVHIALEEADYVVFMADLRTGITDLDGHIADILRRSGKEVFLAVNKADNPAMHYNAAEFYGLGLGDFYTISSINGTGTGELMDALAENAALKNVREEQEHELPRVAVVGRPNVGKSSMINVLIEDDRNIVTPIAGTTRDAINTTYKKYGKELMLIDTAGLRKKGKVSANLEFYSVMRSIRAIEYSDVAVLMLDVSEGVQAQDMSIFQVIKKNNKGVVIVANKWDLIENKEKGFPQIKKEILRRLEPFRDVPVVFTSATEKVRIGKVMEAVQQVVQNRKRRIKTPELNEKILPAIEGYPPPAVKGKYVKIKYLTQIPKYYPVFAVFCNRPQYIGATYKRFVENKIRELFDFTGVPITLYFRKK